MANNWTTAWIKGTGQESEITPVFKSLHISSLAQARLSNNQYHTVNMCDESNHQEREHHFPVGEIVSFYGQWNEGTKEKQIRNWRNGVIAAVKHLKNGEPLLVHCYAGIHRSTLVSSAALTLAYPSEFPDLETAHDFVLTKRIIGWKKEDTFNLMKEIVEDFRNKMTF